MDRPVVIGQDAAITGDRAAVQKLAVARAFDPDRHPRSSARAGTITVPGVFLPPTTRIKRKQMRCTTITVPILLIVGTSCLSGGAPAQLNLTLDQHHVIREIIKEIKPQSVAGPVKVELGDKLPAGIKTQPIPTQAAQRVPQIKAHEFFVFNGQIFIVDPKDKEIDEVIKLTRD